MRICRQCDREQRGQRRIAMAIPPEITGKSLLPPNTSAPEYALEHAMRMDVDLSQVGNLWNPATCPAEILPFLAWGLAISQWDSEWSEAEKRGAIVQAIPFHKRKGTRAAVTEILDRFHPLLQLVEWWQTSPQGDPHTFEVRAPAADIPASFLTQQTADAIIRDVAMAKPVRSHFTFVQSLEAQASAYLAGGTMPAVFGRYDSAAAHDPDPVWETYLQTEDGEPLQAEDGTFLED